jgi:hypothetical protein
MEKNQIGFNEKKPIAQMLLYKKCNLIFILSKLVYTKICSIVQLTVTILALFTHYPSIMVH